MKHIKPIIFTSILTPVATIPFATASCSVYVDCLNHYKPSYEQLNGSYNFETAINKWFEKANSNNDFLKDELYWSNSTGSEWKGEGSILESIKLTYKGEYVQYYVNIAHAKVSNGSQHRLSFKINSEIEEKDEYYKDGVYIGYGIQHYSIEMEIKELAYDVCLEYDDYHAKNYWLIKPVKYDLVDGWTDWLSDDEVLTFTVRKLTEVYDADGVQSYGIETTESAIMDKDLSYISELGYILDYFITFWSYYLDPCTYVE